MGVFMFEHGGPRYEQQVGLSDINFLQGCHYGVLSQRLFPLIRSHFQPSDLKFYRQV
jgi:hypothetical protein